MLLEDLLDDYGIVLANQLGALLLLIHYQRWIHVTKQLLNYLIVAW